LTAGALIAAPYRMAVGLRNLAFDRGWLRAAPAGLPVISVGNLSVGGTGKTPLVLALAGRLLKAEARANP
jgi:tetraacyldisaccharide 4'-kinase